MSGPALMQRLDWNALDEGRRESALRRPAQRTRRETAEAVSAILEQVRAGGDAALRALGARYDGVDLDAFAVGADEIDAAEGELPASLRAAIDQAAARSEAVHAAERLPGEERAQELQRLQVALRPGDRLADREQLAAIGGKTRIDVPSQGSNVPILGGRHRGRHLRDRER